MLDSLGGRSTLVTEVTRETRQSEVVPLTDLRIRDTRSSTQPADRRASASWSQHSSMVTQSWARPCATRRGGNRACWCPSGRTSLGDSRLDDAPEVRQSPQVCPHPSSHWQEPGESGATPPGSHHPEPAGLPPQPQWEVR